VSGFRRFLAFAVVLSFLSTSLAFAIHDHGHPDSDCEALHAISAAVDTVPVAVPAPASSPIPLRIVASAPAPVALPVSDGSRAPPF